MWLLPFTGFCVCPEPVKLKWTFASCISTWTCFGEKSSVYSNFPSVRLSWKACLFKQCITWDDVCGTEGLPQEKVLRGYVRIPLPSHVIMNFPPLCLPSMLLSSGKYLNTRNKCHCLSLTVAQTVIVESTATPMLFLLEFWSTWSSFKSNDNPLLERRIPVRSAGPCSCWAHTRKEGRGGVDGWGEKIKVATPSDRYGKFWPSSSRLLQGKTQSRFSLPAPSGFSNVLLRNCNIAGRDQLSCSACLGDIAGLLCNKGRKWKHTKSIRIWPNKQSLCHVDIKT